MTDPEENVPLEGGDEVAEVPDPIRTFVERTAVEAKEEQFRADYENREAHRDPDPPVADPIRDLLASRRGRRQALRRRLRRPGWR